MSESIDDVLRAAERRSAPPGAGKSVAGTVSRELADEFPGLAVRSLLAERLDRLIAESRKRATADR